MSEINTNTCGTIGERAMSSSVYVCACVCEREEGVFLFAVGGWDDRGREGDGRAGLWVGVIFPLKNKGVT